MENNMEKYLTAQQVKDLINKRPTGVKPEDIMSGLMSRGYKIEGLQATPQPQKPAGGVQGDGVGQWVQPRYLVPLLTLLLAVALYRSSSSKGVGLSSGQIFFIGLGLVVANAISLHTNLRRYLTGLDFNEISLDTAIEWWWVTKPAGDPLFWFSPGNVWLGGVIAFALVFFSLWKLRFELGISDPKTRANEGLELEATKDPSQAK
jgi:hypothetical protein